MKRALRTVSTLAVLATTALASAPARAADPTTADCLSSSEASIALRGQHKLRAARAQLLVCAAANCPADVRTECARRVSEVNAAMPTLVFEAKDPGGNDLSAVKVTVDGEPLVDRLEGTALSLDPGEHAFTFATAGQTTIQKTFVIREGEKDRRERIVFGGAAATGPALPASPATQATPASPLPATPLPATPAAEEPSRGLGTQRTVAVAAAGVGIVGLGVGTVFGLMAMSKHSDAEKACPGQCATQNQVDTWSDARSAGNVSTVGFIVGGVALAGGAVLWLTAKPASSAGSSEQTGLGVRVGPGAIEMKGVW